MPTSLRDLVFRVYEARLSHGGIQLPASLVVEAVLQLVDHGDYLTARRLTAIIHRYSEWDGELLFLWEEDDPEGAGELRALLQNVGVWGYLPDLIELPDCWTCPGWSSFTWACELAERIDYFLAVLEVNRPAAGLARACRRDLDRLHILADWCEETGRPLSAAEARHLHSLIPRI